MASKIYAGRRAKSKARQVYRANRYKSKRAVLKKFSNFVGKVTYKTVRNQRRTRSRRGMSRRLRRGIYRKTRFRMRRMRRRY